VTDGAAMTKRLFAAAAAALILVLGLLRTAPAAAAEDPAAFYKGRTVYLWIGFGAGGDDDRWGHLVAQYMGAHIPGQPTIVPQNLPGSAGLVVTNRLYNAAPKDGSVIALVNRGIPFEPLLAGLGPQFDPLKLNWIGSPNSDTTVCAALKSSPVQTMQDLKTKELTVGATGSGADTQIYPQLLSTLLGMKFKIISGYPGSRAISLAMERNEVQGICVSYDSLSHETVFQEGETNILLQAALKPDPRLKDVPLATDAAPGGIERQALALFFARTEIGRPFVAPPGVPQDRLDALRKGFEETLADPGFIAAAKTQQLNIVPISWQTIADDVAKAYDTPKDVVAATIKALGRSK